VCWIDERRIAFTSQAEVNTAIFIYNVSTKVVEKHVIEDNREIIAHSKLIILTKNRKISKLTKACTEYMCACPNIQNLAVMTKDGLMVLNLRTEKWRRLNSGTTPLQGPLSFSTNGTKIAYMTQVYSSLLYDKVELQF